MNRLKWIMFGVLVSFPAISYGYYGGSRFARNSTYDMLSTVIDNMQTLARITNAIFLEIGLVDGSIPSESLIAELLHMGPVTMGSVVDLNSKEVNESITKAYEFQKGIVSTKDVLDLENRLVQLEQISKDAFVVEDFGKIANANEIPNLMPVISKFAAEKDKIPPVLKDLRMVAGLFAKMTNKTSDISNQEAKDAANLFPAINMSWGSLETTVPKLSTLAELTVPARQLFEAARFNTPLLKESEFRKILGTTVRWQMLDAIKGNLQKIQDVSKDYKGFGAEFDLISKLSQNRRDFWAQSYKYAAGFPRGYQDMSSLLNDTEWVLTRVTNSTLVSGSLKKSFGAFDELNSQLEELESQWEPLNVEESFGNVEVSLKNAKDFAAKLSKPLLDIMDRFKTCAGLGKLFPIADFTHLVASSTALHKLSLQLSQFEGMDYFEDLKDLGSLKAAIEIEPNSEQEKIQMGMNFLSNEEFQKASIGLVRLERDLTGLEKAIPLLGNPFSIDIPPFLEYHQKIYDDHYLKLYKCLFEIGDTKEQMKRFTEGMATVRVLTREESENAYDMVQGVLESQQGLKDLKTSAQGFKNIKTPESLALKKSLPKSEEVSRNLGNAVRGLLAIEQVLEHRENLTSLAAKVDRIQKSANGLLSQEHKDRLTDFKKDLPVVLSGLDEFLNTLGAVDAARRKRESSDFKSSGAVFSAAAMIPGMKIEWKPLKESMKVLNQVSKQKFKTEVETLHILSTLELDFAKFTFGDAVESLNALDSFFSSFGLEVASIPPSRSSGAQGGQLSNGTGSSSGSSGSNSVASETTSFWKTMLIIFIVAALFFFALTIVCFWCSRKRKDVKDMEGGQSDSTENEDTANGAAKNSKTTAAKGNESSDSVVPPSGDSADKRKPDESVEIELEPTQRGSKELLTLADNTADRIAREMNANLESPKVAIDNICKEINDATIDPGPDEYAKQHKKQRRCSKFGFNRATMPILEGFPDAFVDASMMEMNGEKLIISRSPMAATEAGAGMTAVLFVAMLYQHNILLLIQCCPFYENNQVRCAQFYKEAQGQQVECGRYRVTTIENKDKWRAHASNSGQFARYVLKIEDTRDPNGAQKTVKTELILYTEYYDAAGMIKVVELVEYMQGKGNTLVFCYNGLDRSAMLAAEKIGLEMCISGSATTLKEVIEPIRLCRFSAISGPSQVFSVLLVICKGLSRAAKESHWKSVDALEFYQRKCQKKRYDKWELLQNDDQKRQNIECEHLLRDEYCRYLENGEMQLADQEIEKKSSELEEAERKEKKRKALEKRERNARRPAGQGIGGKKKEKSKGGTKPAEQNRKTSDKVEIPKGSNLQSEKSKELDTTQTE